jgi:hypothetical protein
VIEVLTGDMLKGLHPYYGHGVKDHPPDCDWPGSFRGRAGRGRDRGR